jgi:hypothetical protein
MLHRMLRYVAGEVEECETDRCARTKEEPNGGAGLCHLLRPALSKSDARQNKRSLSDSLPQTTRTSLSVYQLNASRIDRCTVNINDNLGTKNVCLSGTATASWPTSKVYLIMCARFQFTVLLN